MLKRLCMIQAMDVVGLNGFHPHRQSSELEKVEIYTLLPREETQVLLNGIRRKRNYEEIIIFLAGL